MKKVMPILFLAILAVAMISIVLVLAQGNGSNGNNETGNGNANNETDEFIIPRKHKDYDGVKENDSMIFFNRCI